MCGIVGILQYESSVSREVRQRALKILFSDTMLATESRGADATGIYQVHRTRPGEDYGDWAMTKKGVKASEWLFQDGDKSDDPVVYSHFMDAWLEHDQELTALVGHCRKATVGSQGRDNDDNHPFVVQLDQKNAILGVHNGTLTNHERIFNKLPAMLKRQGSVDSEAIFHLMFHLSEHGSKPWDPEMMLKLGKRLDGAAACIAVNTRFPNLIATWRFGRPMEFILIAPLNIVLVVSEKRFADSALRKYDLYRRLFDKELPELQIYASTLTDKDFCIFDTAVAWPAGKPGFQGMRKVSTQGDMKPFHSPLEEGWYTPRTTTSAGQSRVGVGSGSYYSGAHATGTGPAGAAKTSKADAKAGDVKALPATAASSSGKTEENDTGVVVEVVIGSEEEAQQAVERARSMGICSHYNHDRDVATALGLPQLGLDKLSKVELANLLAKNHFNMGYAVARFDTKAEIEKARKGGRELTKRLERAEKKKKRSESRIWELKQLATLMLALDSQYPITEQNVKISLAAFGNLSEDRRKDIAKTAADFFTDKSVLKVVHELRQRYAEVERRKRNREKKVAHTKD